MMLRQKQIKVLFYNDVSSYFTNIGNLECETWEEWSKGHGRLERRQCWALRIDNWLQQEHQWPGLKSIALVKSTRTKNNKTTSDERFYTSSLPTDAELLCKAARRHWAIENELHWVLDVVFNENKACFRSDNAATNMDLMRALNILNCQRKNDVSIKSMQRKASMSFKYLTQLLTPVFHA